MIGRSSMRKQLEGGRKRKRTQQEMAKSVPMKKKTRKCGMKKKRMK